MNKKIMPSLLFMILTSALAHSAEIKMASAQAINTVCTEEAKIAQCGDDKVGTGLLGCLVDYKKDHKDFKVSDSCEASLKQLRRDIENKK